MDRQSRELRAKQVGMLMRSYRLAHPVEGNGSRLSQTGLIELMAEEDRTYCDRYDHSTVSRWERGVTMPTPAQLEVFGQALGLASAEVDGLKTLAGLTGEGAATSGSQALEEANIALGDSPAPGAEQADFNRPTPIGADFSSFGTRSALQYFFTHFLLPASCVAVAGYILATYGWSGPIVVGLYVVLAVGAISTRSYLRIRRYGSLQELLYITVFFLLSIPLLHGPLLNIDPYGLFSIDSFTGTTIPFTLSIIVNLLVGMSSALLFALLSKWQSSKSAPGTRPVSRAAWIVVPSLGFVYICLLPFSNVGFWILGLCEFGITAGALVALMVLSDGSVRIDEWDRKFLLYITVTITIILAGLGVVANLFTFMEPSLLAISGETMLYSLETDFDALGYPAEEMVERYRHAVLITSFILLTYMVVVIGGKLIVTIYRLGGGGSPGEATPSGMAPATGSAHPSSSQGLRTQPDERNLLRSLGGIRSLRLLDGVAGAFRRCPKPHLRSIVGGVGMEPKTTES